MKDLLKTAAYLSILSQASQAASNTAALRRIEEDKAWERQREIEEEQQSELDDQVLEQVLLDDIARLSSQLESQGIDVSGDELVKMYHERLEAVDHKLLSDVRYRDRDGEQLKVMVGADLSEYLTFELFAFFQKYSLWWNKLSIEEKLKENQIVLNKLADSSMPSACEVASRITQVSNNQASLLYARSTGKIYSSDLEIELLAAKDSRTSSVNSSQLLILESFPKKKTIMSIPFVKAETPARAYGAYSLKGMLVHNSFGERKNELEGKGINCHQNSLFQEIDNDFYELGWNKPFFDALNSLHNYFPIDKGLVRRQRALDCEVEMTIKRLDALQAGKIKPDQFLRSSQGKWIAGICKGMEDCHGVSTWISRPLFILSASCGFGVIAYGIIAIATKRDSDVL